ncbi:MAG: hypothetical protein AAFY39_13980, partial [Pseudomonadota bacterium]
MNDRLHVWVARVFLLGLIAFAFYYPSMFLAQLVPITFSGPQGWQGIYGVDDTVLVPLWWQPDAEVQQPPP